MQFFSLGIPAHNEEASIERMLERVFKSYAWKNHKGNREIIVCANACTDKTVKIVKRLRRKHPEIRLIQTPLKNKNNAWKLIVDESNPRAKNLFFADADVLIFPDAFNKIESALRKRKDVLIAGSNPIPSAAFTQDRDQYHDDYVRFRRFLRRKGRMDLDGKLYAIRREVAINLRMPQSAHVLDDHYFSFLFRGKKMIVPEARVAYRIGGPHELDSAHVRRMVAKQSMQDLPEVREALESPAGRLKSKVQFVGGMLKAVLFLGPRRTWRVYHQQMKLAPNVQARAQAHIQYKTDAWPQLHSSKLESRRRPHRLK